MAYMVWSNAMARPGYFLVAKDNVDHVSHIGVGVHGTETQIRLRQPVDGIQQVTIQAGALADARLDEPHVPPQDEPITMTGHLRSTGSKIESG